VETKKKSKIISDFSQPNRVASSKHASQFKNKVLIKDQYEKNVHYIGHNQGVTMTPSTMELHAQRIKKTMQQPMIYDTNVIHRPLHKVMQQKSYIKQALLFGLLWTLLTMSLVFILLYRIGK